MSDTVTLVAIPNPFNSSTAACAEIQAGRTIAQMLGDEVSQSCAVTVGGDPVPRKLWHLVRPKAGQTIHATVYPQGGNSGKILRSVAMIAVTIVAWEVAPYLAGTGIFAGANTALVASGLALAGQLAVNALIPPPSAKGLGSSGDPYQQLNSITGTSNQANPNGVIPCVVGQTRFFPCHAALPYTEISGQDQYLRMLLDLGYGDLDISDIQIGSTDIASYDDVEWEIGTSPSLFTQDVYELAVSAELDKAGDTASRTTQSSTTEISLDIVFASGLFAVDKKGNNVTSTVWYSVQYRATGSTGAWTSVGSSTAGLTFSGGLQVSGSNLSVSSGARKALRCGVRWTVPSGQYDVQVTRVTADFGSTPAANQSGASQWTVLRSISPQNPSTTGTTKLAVRIKATNQLNGVVSNLSVLATQKVRRYDPTTSSWMDPVASTNPAWIYHWLMTDCPAVVRRIADDRVDTLSIANWAGECDDKGYTIGFMMSDGRALGDILRDVAAAGRGSFGVRNGQYSIVRDLPQTVPVQMFTPANSNNFSMQRVFTQPSHGLRVTFTNPEATWQNDVITAYADGYDESNATQFETLDLGMVIDPIAAWKLGRYHLAVEWNRPNTYSFQSDVENIVCERGDLIYVAHDVIGYGLAWGRITAISDTSITLDGPFTLESGKSYVIQGRASTLGGASSAITATDDARTFTLAAPLTGIAVGDLYVLGESNQVITPLLVQMIEPSDDFAATITAVDAAPAVLLADSATAPTFVSGITGQAWCEPPAPPVVSIRAGDSAPDDAGVVQAQTGVSSSPQSGIYRGVTIASGAGCVTVDSVLGDGKIAGDVKVGDTLDMADPATLAEASEAVTYSEPKMQPCVEIVTESGIVLRCSTTAPLPTQRDGIVLAPHVAGKSVAVRDSIGSRWEAVKRIRSLGVRQVQHITVNDGCFWAGVEAGRSILHHNKRASASSSTSNLQVA